MITQLNKRYQQWQYNSRYKLGRFLFVCGELLLLDHKLSRLLMYLGHKIHHKVDSEPIEIIERY